MSADILDEEAPRDAGRVCEHCGAKTVEYRHTFNLALASGLFKLYRRDDATSNLKYIGLTRNQWDNFQKMRYWGLVEKAGRDDGSRIGGVWRVTALGRRFIEAGEAIQRRVWTYRGNTVRFEGDHCFFLDFHAPGYEQRPSYAANAQPRQHSKGQP